MFGRSWSILLWDGSLIRTTLSRGLSPGLRERETMAALDDLRPAEENNVPSLKQPKYCFRSLQGQ
ncbi:hypothetical protein J6590_062978 [Homalodisca vitripennis]|nr:hypothetical protein J6590_062978 [Homalodisca vitripennis]